MQNSSLVYKIQSDRTVRMSCPHLGIRMEVHVDCTESHFTAHPFFIFSSFDFLITRINNLVLSLTQLATAR